MACGPLRPFPAVVAEMHEPEMLPESEPATRWAASGPPAVVTPQASLVTTTSTSGHGLELTGQSEVHAGRPRQKWEGAGPDPLQCPSFCSRPNATTSPPKHGTTENPGCSTLYSPGTDGRHLNLRPRSRLPPPPVPWGPAPAGGWHGGAPEPVGASSGLGTNRPGSVRDQHVR